MQNATAAATGQWLTARSHYLNELIKQFPRIMRSGRAFRMVLHRIGRKLKRFQTFNRLVVEVSVGHPDMIRKTFFINRKSVVVARDFNLIGLKNDKRVVPFSFTHLTLPTSGLVVVLGGTGVVKKKIS